MKVAFVVHRYGQEVRGGAEAISREFAVRLAKRGVEIEVFTSCAVDYRSWRNEYEPGTSTDEGVTVHRFATEAERSEDFDDFTGALYAQGPSVTREMQLEWMDKQGPYAPSLVTALQDEAHRFDLVIFVTYLYWTTWNGLQAAPSKAVLNPTAHDEPPIRLPLFDEMFRIPKAFIFYSEPERSYVHRRFELGEIPEAVTGIGIDGPSAPPGPRPASVPEKYLVCFGRVDQSKGVDRLIEHYITYRARRGDAIDLVLMGDPVMDVPPTPGITLLGIVDDETKWSVLANATILVHPSPYESFAHALLEGFMVERPAIVNGNCAVTVDHSCRSGAGLWYRSYAEFEAALDMLLADGDLRDAMGAQGRRYVETTFAWDRVVDRYERFLHSVSSRLT